VIAFVTNQRGIITFIIAVGLCLILGEFVARFAFRHITTTSDNSSYFAHQWKKTLRENSWGFREREFTVAKPQDVYRIAVVGDSYTFGQGIQLEERFTNVLQRRLVSYGARHRFEVLNFGRPGAETIDEVQILRDVVLMMNPDFVLLQWYTNDIEGHEKSHRPTALPLIPSHFLDARLQRSSALYYLFNQQWITLQGNLGWIKSYSDYMSERFKDPDSPASRAGMAALQTFIQLCKERNIPMGIAVFNDVAELAFLTRRVLELCRREHLKCVNMTELLKDQGKLDVANRLDSHPGPIANRFVADQLLQTFREPWVSPTQFAPVAERSD
jgi:lysophospholipase L1-like esterase